MHAPGRVVCVCVCVSARRYWAACVCTGLDGISWYQDGFWKMRENGGSFPFTLLTESF